MNVCKDICELKCLLKCVQKSKFSICVNVDFCISTFLCSCAEICCALRFVFCVCVCVRVCECVCVMLSLSKHLLSPLLLTVLLPFYWHVINSKHTQTRTHTHTVHMQKKVSNALDNTNTCNSANTKHKHTYTKLDCLVVMSQLFIVRWM